MKKIILILVTGHMLIACGPVHSGNPVQQSASPGGMNVGKDLFMGNCVQCHGLNDDKSAPALAGVYSRWKSDTAALVAFVGNSAKYLHQEPENGYAHQLYNKWYKTDMPANGLSAADIKLILSYVNKGIE